MSDVAETIRRFIDDELLEEESTEDPLADGRLDSLSLEQLFAFIEETYGFEFADEELTAEAFADIDAAAALVERKLAVRG